MQVLMSSILQNVYRFMTGDFGEFLAPFKLKTFYSVSVTNVTFYQKKMFYINTQLCKVLLIRH